MSDCCQRLSYAHMKKIKSAAKQNRVFRRFIKQNWVRHQTVNEKIIGMLQDIQDSIEIIARQIARWIKSGQ
jgi:hypothetical protein